MSIDIFQKQKQQWIEEAREVAHKLLKKRYSITIEDVLAVHPLPRFLHRNTIGSVFNQGEFKRLSYEPAKKVSSHGRIISVWTEKLQSDFEAEDKELPKNWRRMRKPAMLGSED
jgi:hypothetical protein